MTATPNITRLLERISQDDPDAMNRVLPLVYDELRHMAQRHLARGGSSATLNATALVHEAYLKLVDQSGLDFNGRDHFLRVCSIVMRNLVIDFARRRSAVKRGGDRERVTLGDAQLRIEAQAEQLLELNEALKKLEEFDPALCRVVECRHFAGLTEEETARALGVTDRTVRRHWVKARTLLHRMLES